MKFGEGWRKKKGKGLTTKWLVSESRSAERNDEQDECVTPMEVAATGDGQRSRAMKSARPECCLNLDSLLPGRQSRKYRTNALRQPSTDLDILLVKALRIVPSGKTSINCKINSKINSVAIAYQRQSFCTISAFEQTPTSFADRKEAPKFVQS